MNDITPPQPPADPNQGPAEPTAVPAQSEPQPSAPAPTAPAAPPPAAQPSTLQVAEPAAAQQPLQPESQAEGSSLGRVAGSFFRGLGFLFSWILFPLAAVLILHFFVFQAYHVVGTSMVPTLHQSDYLIISKVGYTKSLFERDLLHKNDDYIPARNQVIVFHYPKQPDLVFVKRVIALPGERVVIRGGQVTVYNQQHPNGFDPNSLPGAGYEQRTQTTLGDIDEVVPAGSVFVLGDNRTPGGSFDSRDWGDLPSSYIIGNVVMRLLPLDQVKTF